MKSTPRNLMADMRSPKEAVPRVGRVPQGKHLTVAGSKEWGQRSAHYGSGAVRHPQAKRLLLAFLICLSINCYGSPMMMRIVSPWKSPSGSFCNLASSPDESVDSLIASRMLNFPPDLAIKSTAGISGSISYDAPEERRGLLLRESQPTYCV